MKALLVRLIAFLFCAEAIRAQEPSPSSTPSAAIPKGYEICTMERSHRDASGATETEDEKMMSPDGRFAVLCPVRDELHDQEKNSVYPPNLLVRLQPYAVLADVKKPGLPIGWRRDLRAEWSGNSVVAIWEHGKWGIVDLSVYEIENDKVKRVHPVFREARKYFDRDFRQRFLKKYPKEYDSFTFTSGGENPNETPDFKFQGRRLVLDLSAENKPNLAPGPTWRADLHAIWNLDTGKFEKVDFMPGEIGIRPQDE
jgi:hypothetical protein